MSQFTRQSARPLTAQSIRAVTAKLRQRLDTIEVLAGTQDVRKRQQLTRAIHGLSAGAQNLSRRYHGRSVTEDFHAQHNAEQP